MKDKCRDAWTYGTLNENVFLNDMANIVVYCDFVYSIC